MTEVSRVGYEVRVTLPATICAVEDFVRRTRAIWQSGDAAAAAFISELLLRETLTNAVTHGAERNPDGYILCVMRVRPRKLFFLVRGCGSGFDWRAALQRESKTEDCGGRGMEILHHYASRFRFNEFGNQVAVSQDLELGNKK